VFILGWFLITKISFTKYPNWYQIILLQQIYMVKRSIFTVTSSTKVLVNAPITNVFTKSTKTHANIISVVDVNITSKHHCKSKVVNNVVVANNANL